MHNLIHGLVFRRYIMKHTGKPKRDSNDIEIFVKPKYFRKKCATPIVVRVGSVGVMNLNTIR